MANRILASDSGIIQPSTSSRVVLNAMHIILATWVERLATMVRKSLSDIERRLPDGHAFPAFFEDFIAVELPVSIEWNGFKHYSLRRSASKEAVPFARLSDGGLVAFWFRNRSTSIIHIGGHGELEVVAIDFEQFLKAINSKSTGLGDFDDADPPLRFAAVQGRVRRQGLDSLQAELKEWFGGHTSMSKPIDTPEAELLRKKVMEVAKAMLRDGKSKVYSLESRWWSMDFEIAVTEKGLKIKYLRYGKWYNVPPKYKLTPIVRELLMLVKHKNRKKYELSVASYGGVSIDKDKELMLTPPE